MSRTYNYDQRKNHDEPSSKTAANDATLTTSGAPMRAPVFPYDSKVDRR
jgi:hypothetical protein